jgi:serine/threonine-protein kinase RsbW
MTDVASGAFRFTIPNRVEAIEQANAAAEAWLEEQGCGAECSLLVSLAIEELVTNCIKYGYDDSDEHQIGLRMEVVANVLMFEICDDGHPFDPLQAPPPDLTLSLEERPIGGLGLHLLKEMSDGISYERRAGCNLVTLRKAVAERAP